MKINIKLTSNYFNHKGFNYISPLDNYRGQKRSSSMFLSVAGVYVGGGAWVQVLVGLQKSVRLRGSEKLCTAAIICPFTDFQQHDYGNKSR